MPIVDKLFNKCEGLFAKEPYSLTENNIIFLFKSKVQLLRGNSKDTNIDKFLTFPLGIIGRDIINLLKQENYELSRRQQNVYDYVKSIIVNLNDINEISKIGAMLLAGQEKDFKALFEKHGFGKFIRHTQSFAFIYSINSLK